MGPLLEIALGNLYIRRKALNVFACRSLSSHLDFLNMVFSVLILNIRLGTV